MTDLHLPFYEREHRPASFRVRRLYFFLELTEATCLIDGCLHILTFAFRFNERNAGRADEQGIICGAVGGWPLSDGHGFTASRSCAAGISQLLAISLPPALPKLFVDQCTCFSFIETDGLRGCLREF